MEQNPWPVISCSCSPSVAARRGEFKFIPPRISKLGAANECQRQQPQRAMDNLRLALEVPGGHESLRYMAEIPLQVTRLGVTRRHPSYPESDRAKGVDELGFDRTPRTTEGIKPLILVSFVDDYGRLWTREWWPGTESNHRHADFQSAALPTELPGHLGTPASLGKAGSGRVRTRRARIKSAGRRGVKEIGLESGRGDPQRAVPASNWSKTANSRRLGRQRRRRCARPWAW
jgi:hypothetical protein